MKIFMWGSLLISLCFSVSNYAQARRDLPAQDFKIDAPFLHGTKAPSALSAEERDQDHYFFRKKSELARTLIIDKRRALASGIAADLNRVSDHVFATLANQAYVWSDLIGQEPHAFAILSPSKMRVLGDTIINVPLRSLEKNLELYITRLIANFDLNDNLIIEKLAAFLPASSVSMHIEDAVAQQARSLRQKLTTVGDTISLSKADRVIKQLKAISEARFARAREEKPQPAPVSAQTIISADAVRTMISRATNADDQAAIIKLLHGKATQGSARDRHVIDLLWQVEKSLIIASETVRAQQARRLAVFFNNLDAEQIMISLTNADFLLLLDDQGIAAAQGLRVDQFTQIAKALMSTITKDKNAAIIIAKKIVPLLNPDDNTDRTYGALLALMPLAKHVPAMDAAIGFKLIPMGQALKSKYGDATSATMMQALKKAKAN